MTTWPQHNASDAEWNDWRWQMRHRVSDVATLERYVRPTDAERAAIEARLGAAFFHDEVAHAIAIDISFG